MHTSAADFHGDFGTSLVLRHSQGCPRPKFTTLPVQVQVPAVVVVPVQVDKTKPAVVVVPVQVDETAQNRRYLDVTVSRRESRLFMEHPFHLD